jgi:two-component system, cell cycle response regulator DivK
MDGGHRVLVVDDQPLNVELVRALLEADGFEVSAACDAIEAALLLRRNRPNVVLMDIQLPGLDGLTLTRQIKADPLTRGIVVLAFTAYAMKGDEARFLGAGCDGYISKPINVATFTARVRSAMSSR